MNLEKLIRNQNESESDSFSSENEIGVKQNENTNKKMDSKIKRAMYKLFRKKLLSMQSVQESDILKAKAMKKAIKAALELGKQRK